jgi:hypothetical protein
VRQWLQENRECDRQHHLRSFTEKHSLARSRGC